MYVNFVKPFFVASNIYFATFIPNMSALSIAMSKLFLASSNISVSVFFSSCSNYFSFLSSASFFSSNFNNPFMFSFLSILPFSFLFFHSHFFFFLCFSFVFAVGILCRLEDVFLERVLILRAPQKALQCFFILRRSIND